MKNEVFADRMRFFKETEEDLNELSEVDARSVKRGRIEGKAEGKVEGKAEGKAEARLEIAKNLLQLEQLSLEAIARVSGISIDELKQLKKSLRLLNSLVLFFRREQVKLIVFVFCKGADEMKNEVLADRMRLFEETEEGLSELSEVDARSVERGRVEGKAEARLEIAKNLLQLGQLSCFFMFL